MKEVISDLGDTIIEVTARIKKRRNGPSPDMQMGLSKIVNAYRQLITVSKKGRLSEFFDSLEDGNPDYVERLMKGK